MSVQTIDKVGVDLVTTGVNYVTNMVFKLLLEISRERGLAPTYLVERRESIERGLFVWFTEETLKFLRLEVSQPDSAKALEVFELTFSYRSDPTQDLEKPDIERLRKFCRGLQALPARTEYAVKVRLEPGASEVPGWVPTTFKEVDVATEADLTVVSYGKIGASLAYSGSKW